MCRATHRAGAGVQTSGIQQKSYFKFVVILCLSFFGAEPAWTQGAAQPKGIQPKAAPLDHLKDHVRTDDPKSRTARDCVLPARLDPRFFVHPRLDTFLMATQNGENRVLAETIRDMAAPGAFDRNQFSVTPRAQNEPGTSNLD